MSPDRKEVNLTLSAETQNPLELPRDNKGRVIWHLEENTVEANLQLAVTNLRTLFLSRYPEFDRLFPREENDRVAEDKRNEARKFIMGHIGTGAKFKQQFGGVPLTRVPAFKRSIGITLAQTFEPWGIDFDPPQDWVSIKAIAEQKRKNVENIRTIANKFRQNLPDGFEFYRSGKKLIQFYSAEVAFFINQEISDNELPSEEWIPRMVLPHRLERDLSTIRRVAAEFKKDHPDWFRIVDRAIYYSPELEQEIRKMLNPSEELNQISPDEAYEQLRRLLEK